VHQELVICARHHIVQEDSKKIALEDIPVVCEYPDIFLDDLPGMPLDRDVEFKIERQPGTALISRRPYKMAPNELVELKTQLKELLDKIFIREIHLPRVVLHNL
jgi:hypothetical protein